MSMFPETDAGHISPNDGNHLVGKESEKTADGLWDLVGYLTLAGQLQPREIPQTTRIAGRPSRLSSSPFQAQRNRL